MIIDTGLGAQAPPPGDEGEGETDVSDCLPGCNRCTQSEEELKWLRV